MPSELIEDPHFRQRSRFSREVPRIDIRTEPGGGVLADHSHPKPEAR
jgi:hypothetical protein